MTTWNLQGTRHHVLVCGGSSCKKRGGDAVEAAVESEIEALGAEALVHVTRTKCNGRCGDACVVIAYPDGIWYRGLTPQGGRELVGALLRGEPPLEQASYVFGEDGMQSVDGKSKGKPKRGKGGESGTTRDAATVKVSALSLEAAATAESTAAIESAYNEQKRKKKQDGTEEADKERSIREAVERKENAANRNETEGSRKKKSGKKDKTEKKVKKSKKEKKEQKRQKEQKEQKEQKRQKE